MQKKTVCQTECLTVNNSDKKNNDTKPLFAINIPLYYPVAMARSINSIPLIG